MDNLSLKEAFSYFWTHVVAALGKYENDITFEITYANGTTKTIKVLGVEVTDG